MNTADEILFVGVALVSAWTFCAFGVDKFRATRGSSRTPEASLLLLSAAGGAPGALLGMLVFHHKTSKPSFIAKFGLTALVCGSWLTAAHSALS